MFTSTTILGLMTLLMTPFNHVCPKTTQQVEKNRIPCKEDRLSEPADFKDNTFRPLFKAEKQCKTLTAALSDAEKLMPRYIRQLSCAVANRTKRPIAPNVALIFIEKPIKIAF